MDDNLKDKLTAVTANPEQVRDLIVGWESYFEKARVNEDDRDAEFRRIMCTRAGCGPILLTPPKF